MSNQKWAQIIINYLIEQDNNYFCISPGSRSTPLTSAVANQVNSQYLIAIDERGAAFHALGYGKAKGKAAILICTSGTALAEYYPAIIEASLDHIPLIVLSADRPHELWETGSNQTIKQANIFNGYTRWSYSLPIPDNIISDDFVVSTMAQALYTSQFPLPGPVHINCPFREPLEPLQAQKLIDTTSKTFHIPDFKTQTHVLNKISEKINSTQNGCIVIGRLSSKAEVQAVKSICNAIKWPIYADILSNMRSDDELATLITYFDLILLSEFKSSYQPDMIIKFGNQICSKRVQEWMNQSQPEVFLGFQNHSERLDPDHLLTSRIISNYESIAKDLTPLIKSKNSSYLKILNHIDQLIKDYFNDSPIMKSINEVSITRIISEFSNGRALYLSNSMPIRDMNMFSHFIGKNHFIASNRGTSGIDGIIASATGYAIGLNMPLTLVIGDLATLHDLNSLLLVKNLNLPTIIIIINNNGGGIFSFLPIAKNKDIFEEFFGTPHQLTFEYAAKLFQIDYQNPETLEEFSKQYQLAINNHKKVIFEITIDREENMNLHHQIFHEIKTLLDHSSND